ncbi:ATP-dependent DNA helicase RecQ [hydrothermal vent metagenome]|uniref:DNA 3'-5' helicase n=1 Tax=hydrothermal vent metagenome TaxID=652676 RepID=A0A3B0UFU3_9ZZZZ
MSERLGQKTKEILKQVFGFNGFRGTQEPIIKNLLSGNDTFVVMPTGAGKSLCYQLPAIVLPGTAIVISPLIALMKNQVDQLQALGVNARFLNSTLSRTEAKIVKKETIEQKIKLLYVAPESLTKDETVEFLLKANISFIAVDEAHCISEWGHDFRPEYRRIKSIVQQLGEHPIIALTATATPKVQIDIQKNLNMEAASLYMSSFNRTNLYYEIRAKQDIKKQLIRFVKEQKGKAGIVYCLSRKKVEEIAEFLKVNDINAAPYHAGLEAATRVGNQDGFLNEDIDVIVATIAFGMGIDKPDVRFVVHYDVPKSLEGYYQETGRAGRDGIDSKCLMFFSHNDISKLDKFNKDKPIQERDNARLLLQEITSFAESAVCRRVQLLHYFGEEFSKNDCNNCDNCNHPTEQYEGKEPIELVLKTVVATQERFGMLHLVDVIKGTPSEYVLSYKHDKLSVYAKGDTETEDFWRSVIRQTMLAGLLGKDIENIGVIRITERGKAFLKNPESLTLFKNHDFDNLKKEDEEVDTTPMEATAYDEKLYDMLKALRKSVAKTENLPPYVIFQEVSLEEMATIYPCTIEELTTITGVGKGKATKFGEDFVQLIEQYVEDNDIITAADVTVKTTANKSKHKVFIIQQIDKKLELEEVADSLKMSMDQLLDEIEHIVSSGTKLNLDYYMDQVLDDEKQDEILDFFLNDESGDIESALEDEDLADYSEDEIRLMRIKFLSMYAN